MIRVCCAGPASSYRSCVAALLELHPRDLPEGDSALERVLADRGLFTITVHIEPPTNEAFRAYGFWILSGNFGSSLMLGSDVYFSPHAAPDFGDVCDWRCTVLVPFNPYMVRAHNKPRCYYE